MPSGSVFEPFRRSGTCNAVRHLTPPHPVLQGLGRSNFHMCMYECEEIVEDCLVQVLSK
jgi:hypothetical protein